MIKEKKADIFIGTHNRSKELKETIESLNKLNNRKRYNIIVIESGDKPTKINCDWYFYSKDMKPLSEKRNFALKLSKSPYVIFTDDDCIADKYWADNLTDGMKGFECGTGLTLPYKKASKTGFEKIFSFSKIGNQEKIIQKKLFMNLFRIGHGNNMCFDRKIFEKIGVFDENLGVGTKGMAGEDLDMFYRILEAGGKIKYNPKAIIYHNHLVKDEDLEKIAYRNSYAANKLFLGKPNLLYLMTYFGIFLKYSIKILFGNNKIDRQRVRGLLGLKER